MTDARPAPDAFARAAPGKPRGFPAVAPRAAGAWPACAAVAAVLLIGGCARRAMVPQDQLPDLTTRAAAAQGVEAAPAPGDADLRRADRGPRAPRVIHIGDSVEGRALVVEVYGDGPPTTLVLGGIHGDETRGQHVAARFAEFLATHPEATAGRAVAVLALANPDGAARHTRVNARGVDLNRNFPSRNWRASREGSRHYGGPAPVSEPETEAILRLIEMLRPDRILSIHDAANMKPCNNYDGPALGLAECMAACNGYRVAASIGYPTPGSLGSWAGVDRAIPTVTLELPAKRPASECWARNREALAAVVTADLAASPAPPPAGAPPAAPTLAR